MKKSPIIFLDAGTMSLKNLNLSKLKSCGKIIFYPKTSSREIVSRCKNSEIVITNKNIFNRETIRSLPKLKLIAVSATGYNNIDIQAAKEREILVSNVKGYSTSTVVEHTFLFLLAFSHRLIEHQEASMKGEWSRSPAYTLLKFQFHDLHGKTLGIIGYGTIGKKVTNLAKNFGMKILIAAIPGRKYSKNEKRVSLDEVLKKSDFISIHSALNSQTFHLMNQTRISKMKKTAYLLNLARGDLIDEKAVLDVLKKNKIAGYATDLMSQEPPPANHPFFQKAVRNKILMTPHIAWASLESQQRLIDEVAENILAFQRGKKRNQIF